MPFLILWFIIFLIFIVFYRKRLNRVSKAQLFKEHHEAEKYRKILLCPYCMSRTEDLSAVCLNCNEDMSRDAGFEYTAKEYADEEQKSCRYCSQKMLRLAILCPCCRKRDSGKIGM